MHSTVPVQYHAIDEDKLNCWPVSIQLHAGMFWIDSQNYLIKTNYMQY